MNDLLDNKKLGIPLSLAHYSWTIEVYIYGMGGCHKKRPPENNK
jgi:hypothetical protein